MRQSEIVQRLKSLKIRVTLQRIEVARVILRKPQHLSAEQIIERLWDSGSDVSKATVYNTLNLFAEKGLVRELWVDPERRLYDSTTTPHHHVYNLDTGEVTDIDSAGLSVEHLPTLPEGTEFDSVEVMINVRNLEN